jgi:hypothetical protein
MSTSKEELISYVKNWLEIEKEIKTMQKTVKIKKIEKKKITENLVDIMKGNDIDCFDITEGQLLYTKNKVKSSLSKKHLLASLAMYFKDDKEKAKAATGFILESRQTKIKENIRLKMKKK